jgi:hypothetical protein
MLGVLGVVGLMLAGLALPMVLGDEDGRDDDGRDDDGRDDDGPDEEEA